MFYTCQLGSSLTMDNTTNFGVRFWLHNLLPVKPKGESTKFYKSQFFMCKKGVTIIPTFWVLVRGKQNNIDNIVSTVLATL